MTDRMLARSRSMASLVWGSWGRGILIRGLMAHEGLGHEARESLTRALRTRPPDPTQVSCGPLWLACLESGEPMLEAAALARTERLLDAVRCQEAFSHLIWPRSVWIDTVYMVGPLLARAARETGRGDLSAESLRQVRAHMDLLARSDGTYVHTICPALPRLGDPVAWARGNGWLLAGAAEVIETLGPDRCEPVVERTVRLAGTLAERQLDSGLWPALLERPGSPPETSAAALVAIGIHALAGLGLVDPQVASAGRRAALAVLAAVDARGWVRGSQGPVVWARPVPAAGRWPWTQGLALLMAARYLGQGYTLRQEGKRCLEVRSPPS